jgi:nitroimidazol reductase NimA-like FMN-containing flavoprotein (pyridoxamine 5'-phosphate oxidase superfamily)
MRPQRLPKMGKREIDELIGEQTICRIAFKGDEYPYLAPFQYVTHEGSIYFHFTDYGRKMKRIGNDRRVCVGFERLESDLSDYRFVVLSGSIEAVEDEHERAEVIEKMAETCREQLSKNFLPAHGFEREQGWSSLSPEAPIVIVKLVDVVDSIGLMSPY